MLRVKGFNTDFRYFLRWVLFFDRVPALLTCATSPLANASHFAIGSDVSA